MLSSDGLSLGRRQALPIAIASIAGSGILFLPSTVYVRAGGNSGWVWAAATALGLPMLLLFVDVVPHAPPGRAVPWLVGEGLGRRMGQCVPLLFVAIVVPGLPAGAVVAGDYVRRAIGGGRATVMAVAAAVLAIAVMSNLTAGRAGARLQQAATWLLILVVALLVIVTFARSDAARLPSLRPDFSDVGATASTLVLAFWAFTGLENLTLLSDQLRRPERDLLPVGATALVLYGGLAAALTAALAVTIPRDQVDQLTGLLQLARHLPWQALAVVAVLATALTAITMNAVAWTWGVARLIARAAADGVLPAALAQPTSEGPPRRAVLLLAALFAAPTVVLAARPALAVPAIASAGSVFALLYGLCAIAYVRLRGLTWRSVLNLLFLAAVAPALVHSGWPALYGLAVTAAALLARAPRIGRSANEDKP